MRLIDAHLHLADDAFSSCLDEVLFRAFSSGVEALVSCSQNLREFERLCAIKKRHPRRVYMTLGSDPATLNEGYVSEMVKLAMDSAKLLVGIGEVGLDFYYIRGEAERKKQVKFFTTWIRLAERLNLPVVVHSRSAGKYALGVLYQEEADAVLMHAFDGSVGHAAYAVKHGYMFSVPTSVWFSRQKQKLVKHLPLENIMVETDSPVLSPVRGERNEPANLRYAIEKIAEIKRVSVEKVADATFENAKSFFNLDL